VKLLFENWRRYLLEREGSKAAAKQAKLDAFEADKLKFIDSLEQKLKDSVDWDELFAKLEQLPTGKQAHSARVGRHIATATQDPDVIVGALMHDYLERVCGRTLDCLDEFVPTLLTKDQKDIVLFLSSADDDVSKYAGDNEPLDHMKHVLAGLDNQDLKNKLVMIKIGDRVDNLNRRAGGHKPLTDKYLTKSRNLINFLRANYRGNVGYVDGILSALHPIAREALFGGENETPT